MSAQVLDAQLDHPAVLRGGDPAELAVLIAPLGSLKRTWLNASNASSLRWIRAGRSA
jgi:hypothetical protein